MDPLMKVIPVKIPHYKVHGRGGGGEGGVVGLVHTFSELFAVRYSHPLPPDITVCVSV